MKRFEDIPGQKHLQMPTMEPHPGIVHVLTPEYLGIEPSVYEDITDQMIALVSPQRLRQSLFNVSTDKEGSVSFQPIGSDTPVTFAVTPTSYNLLARSPVAMKKHGYSRTESARKKKRDDAVALGELATFGLKPDMTNEDKAAAKRAGAHFNERMEEAMREHLATAIEPRIELIKKFKEASQHPNLSRIGGRGEMREHFSDLSRNVIGDLLSAVSTQSEWTGEQEDLAMRSVVKGLVISGRPGLRAARLRSMLGLTEEWFNYNRIIFVERINWSARAARQAYREAEKYAPRPA